VNIIASLFLAAVGLVASGAAFEATATPPTCTTVSPPFSRDGINLTAALINPAGNLSGDLDATGCNIGVYYGPGANGNVSGANIHGANYYGVVNNGANINVQNSTISDIGEKPLNGTQHGVAVYFCGGVGLPTERCANSNAKGNIQGNYIWNYQKGGIVVNGPLANSNITQNTVIGQGPVDYIEQNGILVGYGAKASVNQNSVFGNSYTDGAIATCSGTCVSSVGILLVGGPCFSAPLTTNVSVNDNVGMENDVGVWFENLALDCIHPVSTPTKDQAQNNTLVNNSINNTSGNGVNPMTSMLQGYQAGIRDQGDMDQIQNNTICGPGYQPPGTASVALFAIDVTDTNNATVQNNTVCAPDP
jgi:hypothetical protein